LPPASPDQLETTKPKADDKSATKPPAKPTAAVDPQREKLFRLLEFSQTDETISDIEFEPLRKKPAPPIQPTETIKSIPANKPRPATANSSDRPRTAPPGKPGAGTLATPTQDLDPEAARLQQLIERLRKDRAAGTGIAGGAAVSTAGSPIKVRVSPNGRIYIESDDTAALDELEEALAELAPPRKDWKVIQLKYPDTWALGIELILHDVFKEEIEAGEKGERRWCRMGSVLRHPAQNDSRRRAAKPVQPPAAEDHLGPRLAHDPRSGSDPRSDADD